MIRSYLPTSQGAGESSPLKRNRKKTEMLEHQRDGWYLLPGCVNYIDFTVLAWSMWLERTFFCTLDISFHVKEPTSLWPSWLAFSFPFQGGSGTYINHKFEETVGTSPLPSSFLSFWERIYTLICCSVFWFCWEWTANGKNQCISITFFSRMDKTHPGLH